MALVTTTEMFKKAYHGGYAVGAFNVNNMEIVQGITEAAGELKSPVILQVSKGARAYANHTYLVKLVEAAVIENPDIPIALHLDHGDSFELCKSCIDGGFTSVMIDASSKSFEDNIAMTKQVVEYAAAVGLATNCTITQNCKFDRKNYFYPDNPQNYQISQLYLPICRNGHVDVTLSDGTEKTIRIHEIHMEEDAGKLVHDEWEGVSYVDYNRSGVPLIEIVSEPDMRSAEEVIAYLTKLRTTIQYLGASDCKLQEGSMRADVNLSVRERGSSEFGTRTETKNLNSFAAIERAIKAETARQIDLIEAGEKVVQETRRWNDDKEYSYAMRSKEDAQDYRYFPDPDLVPIHISDEYLAELKAKQPEFKDEKKARYIEEFGLPEYDAEILTDSKKFTEIFEEATAICNQPKKVSNWIMGETMRLMKEESAKTGREFRAEELTFSPESLAKIITLVEKKEINNAAAKEIFEHVFAENVDVNTYVEEHGLKQVNDEGALRATVEKVIADNPQSVADYKGGKKQAIGYLVGQTMKAMQGKANPGMVNALLQELLK
jgi:aspartyl-tRNA(Asn)/glutamyl-tRNA(Gln) amidotransferase subunit B